MGDDAELLDAWAAGDSSAGRAFYTRYADRITRFFARKTNDEVPELVQRTFLKCLEAKKAGTSFDHPAAVLFTIARNELYDAFRRRGRAAQPFDPDATSLEDLKTGASQVLARLEQQRLLLAALRRIPLDHQLAVELHYWEELSTDDVARVLGVTRSAVLNRLYRARQAIRDELSKLEATPALVERTMSGFETWARGLREEG